MKDYNISKISVNDDGVSEMVLSGQLIAKNAGRIKAELAKVNVKTSKLIFSLIDVEDIDTSMVQLIEVFKIKQAKKKIEIEYNYQLNADLSVLLVRSGIIK